MKRYFNSWTEMLWNNAKNRLANDSEPNELDKLEKFLIEKDISYERRTKRYKGLLVQNIIAVPNFDDRKWDAVCQYGTYGYESGLLEVMGTIVNRIRKNDIYNGFAGDANGGANNVIGWLTADAIITHIDLTNPEA